MTQPKSRFLSFFSSAQAIFWGLLAGVAAGLFLGPKAESLRPIGSIFISLLKLVVVPLVFASIVVGVYRTGTLTRLGTLGGRTLLYYLATTSLAILLGLVLVNLIQPGAGVHLESSGAETDLGSTASFTEFISRLIPENIFSAFSETNILGIIIFAILLGMALLYSGKRAEALISLLKSVEEVFLVLTRGVIWFAPIGVVGLIAPLIGTFGFSVLASFGKFVLVVLFGLFIHGLIVLPLLFKFFSGRSIRDYLSAVKGALVMAFATSSSSATLPVSLASAKEAGIQEETSSFVLPLGATVNMDGTALYEAVVAVFIAQTLGIDLSPFQQLIIYVTATLASIGAAGIPSAGLVTILIVLQAVGLPAVGLGILFAIDRPLDMCRTTVNVWGDLVGCAVVERRVK
ncbi:MAG: dicarboxylate/amino acid:cation symporter [Candidatus Omnitrophica bacterium]|nr:dicarboxylate/amino acid:cation symporter [Candidatus Omnitrophota bacterium]